MPKPLKPHALAPGSTIAVISPASSAKQDRVRRGCDNLEQLGYRVQDISANRKPDGYFSGTFESRLKELQDALTNLDYQAVFCSRGGYGSSPREPWRQHLGFEDSPSCMNYDANENPAPCEECVLMQLVPAAQRGAKIPCRQIPLTKEGETLECLYRCGTQLEIEDAMRNWLRSTIQQIESQRVHAGTVRA